MAAGGYAALGFALISTGFSLTTPIEIKLTHYLQAAPLPIFRILNVRLSGTQRAARLSQLRTGSDFGYHVPMAHQHSTRFLDIVNDAKKRVRETTVDDVKQKLDHNDEFLIIDVREDSEWQTDHLPRAIHLSKGVIERDIEQRVPDPNAPIVVYCGGGFRSALAAENLGRMGYKNVLSMDGGIRVWREKGYPLTKE